MKEISIIYNIGTSKEDFGYKEMSMGYMQKIMISMYDENAIKNNNITILEGRMPENNSEIVLSDHSRKHNVGDEIKLTINEEEKIYTIVGVVKSTLSDVGGFNFEYIEGAITYYDEKQIKDESIVDVSIITDNIHDIYKTSEYLANTLNLYKTEDEKEANISYNTQLLNFSLVRGKNLEQEDTRMMSQEFGSTIAKVRIEYNSYYRNNFNSCNIYYI